MNVWDKRGWLAATQADIAAPQASWHSVRGGGRGARQDAAELIRHRRVLVDTQAMTPDGMRTVLRTRLRLIGDAVRFFVLAGTLGSAAGALHRILVTEASQLVEAVLTDR